MYSTELKLEIIQR